MECAGHCMVIAIGMCQASQYKVAIGDIDRRSGNHDSKASDFTCVGRSYMCQYIEL